MKSRSGIHGDAWWNGFWFALFSAQASQASPSVDPDTDLFLRIVCGVGAAVALYRSLADWSKLRASGRTRLWKPGKGRS